jgi:hypothetical protein
MKPEDPEVADAHSDHDASSGQEDRSAADGYPRPERPIEGCGF